MSKISKISDLDGDYLVIYQTDAPPLNFEWFDHTTANAKLSNGKLIGRDAGGVDWLADFSLPPDAKKVEFRAVVKLDTAPATTFVLDKHGKPTKVSQEYTGTLNINIFEGRLVVQGLVLHGVCNITVIMKREQQCQPE